jgi:hypothetical protein
LRNRRLGGNNNYKRAIHQASNAVESVMKALLRSRGLPEPHEPAPALFARLADPGSGVGVPPFTKKLVLAAADLRNMRAGHGQGSTVRQAPEEVADAAIASAATAIALLGHYLPT